MAAALNPSVDVVKTVIHPLVKSMYMKKDYHIGHPSENVLVIETNFNRQSDADNDNSDSYLVDLLIDLQDLKEQAEKEMGSISRVDIRRH